MVIRSLLPGDDRSLFRSANVDLNRFFQLYAGQNQFRHHIGVTYVAIDENIAGNPIVGYATLASGSIEEEKLRSQLSLKLPEYPWPVLRLVRFAVDERAQGRGIGKELLRFVLLQAMEMSKRFGCVGVLVDAKPDAVTFYERYSFERIQLVQGELSSRPPPVSMFLPLKAIQRAMESWNKK